MPTSPGAAGPAPETPDTFAGCTLAAALRTPDAPAVVDGTGALTYSQLVRTARQLADLLADHPPGRVALLCTNDATTVAAELGIALAGRAFVPLDRLHPPARLAAVAAAAEASLVVVPPGRDTDTGALLEGRTELRWSPTPVRSGPLGPAESALPGTTVDSELSLLFSSGTTGSPKGIVHTQRFAVAAVRTALLQGCGGPDERILQLAPMASAPGLFFLAWAIGSGATLFVHDTQEHGLAPVPEAIRTWRITGVPGVTSALRGAWGAARGDELAEVRWVLVGGESITAGDVAQFRLRSPRLTVHPSYISSELGAVTIRAIGPDEVLTEDDPLHSGAPVATGFLRGVEVHAEDGFVLPAGEVGTIEVRTEPISRYVHEEATTDEVVFSTRDFGRYLPGGQLQVLGRTDQVVKVRGHTVDLVSVELEVRELPQVADAVVVLGASRSGSSQLVAYVVAHTGAAPTEAEVREALLARLPAPMVPSRVELLDELPRLPNRKPDRVTLQARARPDADGSTPAASPRTPHERAIAAAFSAVLGIEEIGVDDDFFDLGGTSLDVAELLIRLEVELGVPVTASVLALHTTPEHIAATLLPGPDRARSTHVLVQGGTPARPAIHLVYDLHGSPFRLRQLAAALGPDQPALGFECPYIYGEPGEPMDYEALAARHAADLVATQPTGPYHLCGYSVGGLLTYEIARQLEQGGHEVGFVGIVDYGPSLVGAPWDRRFGPKPPGRHPRRAPAAARPGARVRHHLRNVAGRAWPDRLAYVAQQVHVDKELSLWTARRDLAGRGRVRPELRGAWTWFNLIDATDGWRCRPTELDVTLFLCDQTSSGNIPVSRRISYPERTDPTLGWEAYARSVDVRPITGFHNALAEEPYVAGVGAAVRSALDAWLDARAGTGAGAADLGA